jgi:ParB-like nuclease domain
VISTGNPRMDAERAYDRAWSARRRHMLVTRLRRRCIECAQLTVLDTRNRRSNPTAGVREIPIEAITATVEPSRARQFDAAFRPAAKITRGRWERLWIAEQQGESLPPIDVVKTGCGYAVVDGHHRISVALARGATTIDAVVSA